MKGSNKMYRIFGLIIGLIGYASTWYLYDWKLMIIIFILIWSNNIAIVDK
jgi:hypothetical protein